MATRSMPFWPRPATTSGSSWPGSGLCAPFSGRLSWSGITRAAPPPHPPERPNSLFHRRLAGVRDHLRADLHDLLAKRGQRPALDLIGQGEGAEEVGQVVRQRMKLEPDRVGLHGAARQACPLRGILALSDPLLRCAALIVEGHHALGRTA